MLFSYKVTKFTGHEGGTISNTDICSWGKKLNETEIKTKVRKKKFVPSLLLSANECLGIMANAR